jgi:hypothetical protein
MFCVHQSAALVGAHAPAMFRFGGYHVFRHKVVVVGGASSRSAVQWRKITGFRDRRRYETDAAPSLAFRCVPHSFTIRCETRSSKVRPWHARLNEGECSRCGSPGRDVCLGKGN